MSRVFYAALLLVALACSAAAQTRPGRTATPPARPRPTPTRPAQTPAAQTPAAQPPAAAQTQADECGCEAGPVPEVLGAVNGIRVTRADLSPQSQQRIAQMKQGVVEARRRELELQINSILLEAEAKKRGVSTVKLLEAEVVAKSQEPTVAEAEAYFNQNKARLETQAGRPVPFAEVRDKLISFLLDQRQQERARQFADSLRAAYAVKKNVEFATPPATPADRARVFATVNGRAITSGDIEDSLLPLVATVQEQLYIVRKDDVDMRVNDILLNQEATKRGVTANAVLQAEVGAKTPAVTEAQALDFYNKNKGRINGEFAQLKGQIIEYLQEQEQQRLSGAFAERLRNGASVQTFITPPPAPSFKIATDDQPSKGNPNAPVTLVEFTDYQCPSCAAAQPVIDRLLAEYGDRLRLVVRDFPLEQHADAFKAAEAAEAARAQGKYWEYAAVLMQNQSALGPAKLKEYAGRLGLDRAKFDAALDAGEFADAVRRDLQDGFRLGVNSTPSIFVNGRRASGRTYEALKASIEAALKTGAASDGAAASR